MCMFQICLFPLNAAKIWDRLPHLKAVVMYKGPLLEKRPGLYTVTYGE